MQHQLQRPVLNLSLCVGALAREAPTARSTIDRGGIGLHLMEGRQAAIIAHCLRGAPLAARTELEESTPTQPWEQQVYSCLNVMCSAPNDASISRNVTAMVGHFLGREPVPGYAVFRARLGLTVATLADVADAGAADRVLAQVVVETVEAGDGYAARDVLGYRSPRIGLTDVRREALSELVTRSGLGSGILPEPLLDSLINSTRIAKEALTASMRAIVPAFKGNCRNLGMEPT